MPETQSGKRYLRRGNGLPEIGWRNGQPSVPIHEDRLGALLVAFAKDAYTFGCQEDWCEACNPMRRVWWDVYNECTRELRLAVAEILAEAEIPLMPGFYDEAPLP